MDIIVTTPRSEMANSAREAAECIAMGGGTYFRRLGIHAANVMPGDRVYYVEQGFIRGFCLVNCTHLSQSLVECDSTGRHWPPGFYVFMNANTWHWIKVLPMKGFQGFRYASRARWPDDAPGDPDPQGWLSSGGRTLGLVEVIGGWKDPRPKVIV